MDVSYTDHSHVIGKGGNNIKRVMQETGCHIHFPDSNRGNNVQEKSNQVSIAGQPQGVEAARIHIRELLPLVFMFELPVTTVPQQIPDVSSPALQQLQTHYNVSITFRQRARMYATMVIVRGSVCNEKLVKEATTKLMEMLIGTLPTPVAVSMQLEIAPQHHLFIIGRNGMNIKQIMQATGAAIHFPDPNTVTAQRKGTVFITGTIDSVYLARQQLIGCLPLVLMFDVKEDIDMDQARLTQLMEQLDVFISVKPKPKQPSKSVIVKSIERNAPNMYLARLLLLGLQKGPPRPVVNPAGDGTHPALSLTALGYFGQHVYAPTSTAVSVTTSNQILMVNGQRTPPAAASPALSSAHSPISPSSTSSPSTPNHWMAPPPGTGNSPAVTSAHNPIRPSSTSSPGTPNHWMAPPPGIYAPMMVLPPGTTCSIQNTIDLLNQCNVNGLQKDLTHNGALRIATPLDPHPGSTGHSEVNSPSRSPSHSPHSPISFRDNTVDLAGLSTTTTASFGKIEIQAHEPSLTSSGHTMDLLGLSKTTSPPMNEISFLNSSLGNGSLHNSLNRNTLTNGDDRQTLVDDPVDLLAPGIERKNSTNLFTEGYPAFTVDYEQKKLLANKAMQQKPIGESRIPTDFWSGLGFSKSMPESAIRERLQQMGVKQRYMRYEPPMATTYENMAGELSSEVDRDPWRDSSAHLHNRPINPAPGEYPSPRKKYEFNGLSASNYIDGSLVPSKSYWSPKTDLAELFINLGLGKYTDLFLQQEIDLATFLTLTDQDLRELGISTFGARRKMLLAIADLNKRRTLSSINDTFEAPSNNPLSPSNNPFQDSEPVSGSRTDIASISGRW